MSGIPPESDPVSGGPGGGGRGGPGPADEVRALLFDVFGTVVDWRSAILRQAPEIGEARGFELDWEELADRWRDRYRPTLRRVIRGEIPFRPLEELQRESLDAVLEELGGTGVEAEARDELNRIWRRLDPWPDAAGGLARLRRKYVLSTLSNGNVGLLVAIARHGELPWDCVLSAQLAGTYKPDPPVYHTAAELLGMAPEEMMLVASHTYDLRAAVELGFRTAFVPRPLEWGPEGRERAEVEPHPSFDVVAGDFVELAERLGA